MKQLLVSMLILASCSIMVFATGTMEKESSQTMMDSPDTEDTEVMMEDKDSIKMGGKVSFTGLDDARAIAGRGPAVLFFYADWCPTCKVAMKSIDENSKKLGDITVVVVNYDKARDLREKYLVTYQHTFVQIDENGDKIALWNGGGVETIVKNIQEQES